MDYKNAIFLQFYHICKLYISLYLKEEFNFHINELLIKLIHYLNNILKFIFYLLCGQKIFALFEKESHIVKIIESQKIIL